MFGFQCGSFHVSRDDAYNDNTIVKNSIYQEFVSNPNGVHWDVNIRRYKIVGNNLIYYFQGIILTPRVATYVANVAFKASIVTQESSNKEDTPISLSHFASSTFIDFNNSFDEDCLLACKF